MKRALLIALASCGDNLAPRVHFVDPDAAIDAAPDACSSEASAGCCADLATAGACAALSAPDICGVLACHLADCTIVSVAFCGPPSCATVDCVPGKIACGFLNPDAGTFDHPEICDCETTTGATVRCHN